MKFTGKKMPGAVLEHTGRLATFMSHYTCSNLFCNTNNVSHETKQCGFPQDVSSWEKSGIITESTKIRRVGSYMKFMKCSPGQEQKKKKINPHS